MKEIFILTASSFFVLASCNRDIKFEKEKWLKLDDMEYPYRESMLHDLTTNYQLKGLSYKQLTDLIGEQQKNLIGNSNEINYPIFTEYSGIDPVHSITLVFKLDKDSIVTGYYIDDWKRGMNREK